MCVGDEREHVLLTGRPGLGESTALRQLVVALAETDLSPQEEGEQETGEGSMLVWVQLQGRAPGLEAIG